MLSLVLIINGLNKKNNLFQKLKTLKKIINNNK
jgi:hypothetical protein